MWRASSISTSGSSPVPAAARLACSSFAHLRTCTRRSSRTPRAGSARAAGPRSSTDLADLGDGRARAARRSSASSRRSSGSAPFRAIRTRARRRSRRPLPRSTPPIVAALPKDGTWDRAVATELVRITRGLVVFVTSSDLAQVTLLNGTENVSTRDVRSRRRAHRRRQASLAERRRRGGAGRAPRPGHPLARGVVGEGSPRRPARTHGVASRARRNLARPLAPCSPASRSPAARFRSRRSRRSVTTRSPRSTSSSPRRSRSRTQLPRLALHELRRLARSRSNATEAERLATARLLAGGPRLRPRSLGLRPSRRAPRRGRRHRGRRRGDREGRSAASRTARRPTRSTTAGSPPSRPSWARAGSSSACAALIARSRWARRTMRSAGARAPRRSSPDDPTIALLMGRALMQLGDLVAARVSPAEGRGRCERRRAPRSRRLRARRAQLPRAAISSSPPSTRPAPSRSPRRRRRASAAATRSARSSSSRRAGTTPTRTSPRTRSPRRPPARRPPSSALA